MLTPAFELTQNDNFLIASIRIPYAKITDSEVYFEDYEFKFHCKPYFLRLNLPGKVMHTEEPSVKYNSDTGIMVIEMPKVTPKETFGDLDLITKLLAPKITPNVTTPKIEVIGHVEHLEEEEENFEIEQPIPEDESLFLCEAKCGFANMYSCSVFRLKEEVSEICDINNPTAGAVDRSEERLRSEALHFSDDYYLENLFNDKKVQLLISYVPDYERLYYKVSSSKNCDENVHFTAEEKERLRRLPNKEYLLEKPDVKRAWFGLIDILFAYAYNKRTLMDENTVESAWTINKISATLSSLATFSSMKEAATSSIRRSLCYPFIRHWGLCRAVFNDVIVILSLGQKYVLKCFLEIHEVFCLSDPRYILNDLYITDYCVWIQGKRCRSKTLLLLAETLKQLKISKKDMNLDLEELEAGAKLVLFENLTKNMDKITLDSDQVSSDSSDSDTSEDDDETTSEEDDETTSE